MPRITHFEFPADDPERAIKFYEDVFDWKTYKWEGPFDYWLVTTGEAPEPGIDGAIMRRGDGGGVINTVGVLDIDAALEKIVAAGGQVVMPKTTVPGQGYMARCLDTEGTLFGLMQTDMDAK